MYTIELKMLFLFLVVVISCVRGESFDYYSKNGVRVRGGGGDFLIETLETKCKFTCLRECNRMLDCDSCSYNNNNRECLLFSKSFDKTELLLTSNESNYYIKKAISLRTTTTTATSTITCRDGWFRMENMCLYRHDVKMGFDAGKAFCESQNASLITVKSQREFDLLTNISLSQIFPIYGWAGGILLQGKYYWIDDYEMVDMTKRWYWKKIGGQCMYFVGCEPPEVATSELNIPCKQPGFSFDTWNCDRSYDINCQYRLDV